MTTFLFNFLYAIAIDKATRAFGTPAGVARESITVMPRVNSPRVSTST